MQLGLVGAFCPYVSKFFITIHAFETKNSAIELCLEACKAVWHTVYIIEKSLLQH